MDGVQILLSYLVTIVSKVESKEKVLWRSWYTIRLLLNISRHLSRLLSQFFVICYFDINSILIKNWATHSVSFIPGHTLNPDTFKDTQLRGKWKWTNCINWISRIVY